MSPVSGSDWLLVIPFQGNYAKQADLQGVQFLKYDLGGNNPLAREEGEDCFD